MRIVSFILVMLLPVALLAQQKHFLYIQGENQQPFYLKMEGVIYSSSATGYIIVPRLEKGTVELTIGFPRAQWPEQAFTINVQSDKGLVLKNNQDKFWVMQDLQTQSVMEGRQVVAMKEALKDAEKRKTDDAFASSLADAINDPGIRDADLVKTETSKTTLAPPKKVQPVATADVPTAPIQTPVKANADSSTAKLIKPKVEQPQLESKIDVQPKLVDKPFVNAVTKLNDSRNGTFLEQIFIDQNGEKIDTITLQIALPNDTIVSIPNAPSEVNKDSIRMEQPTLTEKVIVVESKNEVQQAPKEISKSEPSKATEVNYEKTAAAVLPDRKDCKQIATEKDMISARKKAYTLGVDAEVIKHYNKEVKSRCYSVALIQSLSFAFVNDASRYQFFQEAYPWVMDPANYQVLERLFASKEYIAKFRQLINAE